MSFSCLAISAIILSSRSLSYQILVNLTTGKLNRGLSVIDSYQLLKGGKELTAEEFFDASVLGWCIEWV